MWFRWIPRVGGFWETTAAKPLALEEKRDSGRVVGGRVVCVGGLGG